MKNLTLGILGGLGPMSGIYFCELLTAHTRAERDCEHLDFLLSSRASTPDRTDFILGASKNDPTPIMVEEVKRLTAMGADIIVIPCNTAHYFYESVAKATTVPVVNIIEETVGFCAFKGLSRVAVLSTDGTAKAGEYKSLLQKSGISTVECTSEEQKTVTDIIYNKIKKGLCADREEFMSVANALRGRGAEAIILGCTELSLVKKQLSLGEEFTDSLEVLALSAIKLCSKEPQGFESALMNYKPERMEKS